MLLSKMYNFSFLFVIYLSVTTTEDIMWLIMFMTIRFVVYNIARNSASRWTSVD
jgi:hypothetical protein